MKSYLKALGIGICSLMLFVGCGKEKEIENSSKEITLSIWEGTGEDYMMELNSLSNAYKKVNPNVTLKIEKIPGADYDTAMKIRNTAQQLPDIFAVRNKHMYTYKDSVIDLSDLEAAKLNVFSEAYKINNKVIGLPMYGFNEFVYYRKSIFKEAGVEVPTTWGEFVDISTKIKATDKYIPVALGGKDSWVVYPFNEFMPFLVSGGNDIWTKMGVDDAPFSKGKPFYTAYEMLNNYYKTKPFGDDPLGYGWDQEKSMFVSKKAAMLAAGQWFYLDLQKDLSKEELDDIGVFVLPARETKEDPFRYLVTAEVFLSIPKYSKNAAEAKEFLNWLFQSDYYKEYVKYMNVLPSVEGVEGNDNLFNETIANIPNPEVVLQKGGDAKYRDIANFLSFDVKRMGQEMLQGVDFEKYMDDLNNRWKEARENTK